MTVESPYMSVQELAGYLAVSRRTAYMLVVSGQVPSVKIGGQHRIPREELAKQLTERTRGRVPIR